MIEVEEQPLDHLEGLAAATEGTEQPLDQSKRAGAVAAKGPPQQMEQHPIASPAPGMNTSSLSNHLNDLYLNEEKSFPTPITNSPPPLKNGPPPPHSKVPPIQTRQPPLPP